MHRPELHMRTYTDQKAVELNSKRRLKCASAMSSRQVFAPLSGAPRNLSNGTSDRQFIVIIAPAKRACTHELYCVL